MKRQDNSGKKSYCLRFMYTTAIACRICTIMNVIWTLSTSHLLSNWTWEWVRKTLQVTHQQMLKSIAAGRATTYMEETNFRTMHSTVKLESPRSMTKRKTLPSTRSLASRSNHLATLARPTLNSSCYQRHARTSSAISCSTSLHRSIETIRTMAV